MRRALVFLTAALALAVVPLGSAETTYTDPTGDSELAPDITTVRVSNTPDGTVSFAIGIGNYTVLPTLPTAITGIALWLDLDKNPQTGDDGDEGYASFDSSGAVDFERWDGKEMVDVPETNMSSSFANGVLSFTAARNELMNTSGFTFEVLTLYIPATPGIHPLQADLAPDSGLSDWTYDLVLPPPPPVKPVIGTAAATPTQPIAGRRFTMTFPVTRSDDGAPLVTGTLACTTRAGGKVVPHRRTFKAGKGRVTLTVPKTAKGKQLKIAVKVTADTAATKIFTYKIR